MRPTVTQTVDEILHGVAESPLVEEVDQSEDGIRVSFHDPAVVGSSLTKKLLYRGYAVKYLGDDVAVFERIDESAEFVGGGAS